MRNKNYWSYFIGWTYFS